MLDLVVVAMAVVLPVLGGSIALAKYRRQYALHKRIQLVLGAVLLVTVALFEVDMRVNGWRHRAEASPYWPGSSGGTNWVDWALAVHIVFAATTTLLWALVIARALRNFPHPPAPAAHTRVAPPLGPPGGDRHAAHGPDRLDVLLAGVCRVSGGEGLEGGE